MVLSFFSQDFDQSLCYSSGSSWDFSLSLVWGSVLCNANTFLIFFFFKLRIIGFGSFSVKSIRCQWPQPLHPNMRVTFLKNQNLAAFWRKWESANSKTEEPLSAARSQTREILSAPNKLITDQIPSSKFSWIGLIWAMWDGCCQVWAQSGQRDAIGMCWKLVLWVTKLNQVDHKTPKCPRII